MSGGRALAKLELLTALRDRAALTAFPMSIVAGLAGPPLLPHGVALLKEIGARADRADTPVEAAEPCGQDTPEVAVAGEWPDWMAWPAARNAAGGPGVPVSVRGEDDGMLRFEVGDGPEAGSRGRVTACIDARIEARRQERFRALGLTADPGEISRITVVDGPPSVASLPELVARVSPLGSMLGIYALVVAGGIAIAAVPRRRASGLLEQLRSTQTDTRTLVVAWVAAILGLTLVHLGLVVASWIGSSLVNGLPLASLSAGLHAPVFALAIVVASVRSSLHAADVQSATLRWFGVIFALMGTAALAGAAIGSGRPWLAALIPLGGGMVATTGLLGPWGFLADLAGVAWCAAGVLWCARSLDAEESSAPGMDPGLARRARGNYAPEALVLGAIGMSNAVAAGVGGDLPWVGITAAFVGFMLLPALLASTVVGLPRRELLPFGPVVARDVALAVPAAIGLGALGSLVVAGTMAVLPRNEVIDAFAKGLAGLASGPFGILAIAVYPAVCEELLYRGAIQGLLLRSGNRNLAIVGQAVAFSAAHIISIRLPWTFVLGLVLGWLRVRTGSLWAGMAIHFTLNLSVGLLVAWMGPDADPAALPGWLPVLLVGLVALPFIGRRPA